MTKSFIMLHTLYTNGKRDDVILNGFQQKTFPVCFDSQYKIVRRFSRLEGYANIYIMNSVELFTIRLDMSRKYVCLIAFFSVFFQNSIYNFHTTIDHSGTKPTTTMICFDYSCCVWLFKSWAARNALQTRSWRY